MTFTKFDDGKSRFDNDATPLQVTIRLLPTLKRQDRREVTFEKYLIDSLLYLSEIKFEVNEGAGRLRLETKDKIGFNRRILKPTVFSF